MHHIDSDGWVLVKIDTLDKLDNMLGVARVAACQRNLRASRLWDTSLTGNSSDGLSPD
jgi:hypothetical protein